MNRFPDLSAYAMYFIYKWPSERRLLQRLLHIINSDITVVAIQDIQRDDQQ